MHKTTGQSVKTTRDRQPNTPTPDNIATFYGLNGMYMLNNA